MRKGKPIDINILNAGYRYALSLCSNRADAEDIVHDAWIRLDNRYKKAPEKTLLYTTIRNLYIDQYRRAQKIRFSEFEEQAHEAETSAPNRLTSEEMSRYLRHLRDVEREALFLAVVEGYTADEISAMTSTARGTVLSLIHRAKGKLRTRMSGENIASERTAGAAAKVVELVPGIRSR